MGADDEKKQSDNDVEMKEIDNDAFDEAVSIEDVRPDRAMELYRSLLAEDDPEGRLVKVKEESINRLGRLYTKHGRVKELKQLFVDMQPFFGTIPKSRTGKIVRGLIDHVVGSVELASAHRKAVDEVMAKSGTIDRKAALASVPSVQVEIIQQAIAWCQREKRTFLKQRLQSRLASLYVKLKQYNDALPLINKLIREVKKFDDKLLLVEIFLVESRAHLALQNIPKSKGALTAARSNANSIYCPPSLQAEIDLQAGILCSVEGDFKTAFSYFYEAFEGYTTIKDPDTAVRALKYMLLAKIMNNQYEDVYSIINGKAGVKHAGIEIESMKSITDAYKARSIQRFQSVQAEYAEQLQEDQLIATHLTELQDKLLEQNLIRIIEPFSRVQIDHVATLIKLDRQQVETKLSEMILDSKLNGILDQGTGDLILFNEDLGDKSYTHAEATVKELNNVVDRLYARAKLLTR